MKRLLSISILLIAVTFVFAKKTVIKMATLAPEGTDWHGTLMDMGQRWKEATDGEVVLRIYPGGVVGDERDMIRKMRIGQIHAAGISAEGLSEINPDFGMFHIPLLYEDYNDVDYLRYRLGDELRRGVDENGFQLLYMADVGWAYWFTRDSVATPEDLKRLSIFTWAGDFRTAELWKKGGFNPVPLAAIDVLSGLQTGLIDGIATTPMYALAQQWFGEANHMLDMKWGVLTAGVVIDNRIWKRISPEHQQVIMKIAVEIGKRHQASTRHLDSDAIQAMMKYGLKIHQQTQQERAIWVEYIRRWYPLIRGSYISDEVFDKAVQIIGEFHETRTNE